MNVRRTKPLLLVPLLLASCTKDFTMQEVTSTRVSASAGGIAKSHDGLVEVEFAPGALAADTDIRIEAKRDLMSSEIESRAVYDLGPDGLTFEGQVTVRFRVDAGGEELVVVNLDTGEPAEIATSSHDVASGVVTAQLEHFSLYALILRYRACRNKTCGDSCSLCPPWRPTCTEPPGGPRVCGPQGLCVAQSSPEALCHYDGGTTSPFRDGGPPRDGGETSGLDTGVYDAPIRDGSVSGVVTEVEPNNTWQDAQTLAVDVGLPATVIASINPAGDQDYFAFIVPPGQSIEVQATTYDQAQPYGCLTADTVLTLFDNAQTELMSNDDYGVGGCSRVTSVLPSGLYYLRVRQFAGQTIPSYRLEVLFRLVGSGGDGGVRDGAVTPAVDAGVGSDGGPGPSDGGPGPSDGGPTRDGGISTYFESEPNDTLAQANFYGLPATVAGAIDPVGDVDLFVYTIPPTVSQLSLTTYTQLGDPTVCVGADTVLRLFDGAGTQLTSNDDYSGLSCSRIVWSVMPGQTYYFRVEHFGNNGTIPSYFLDAFIQ
ncbi:MAG: hypothetical protein RMA76_12830 [Deltaproteobacteria bacterium]|jgi:hypothetical protein